jgi:GNAT superfamily N-acetyltransferase
MRQVGIGELESVAELAVEFYASSKFLRGFNREHFVTLWTSILSTESGVIFALFDGDIVAGAIAGTVYPEAYSNEKIAQEWFWFLRSAYRGKALASVQLYKRFERWAKEKGCVEIRMGHLSDLMPEKVASFYRRLGYSQVETNYSKRLVA